MGSPTRHSRLPVLCLCSASEYSHSADVLLRLWSIYDPESSVGTNREINPRDQGYQMNFANIMSCRLQRKTGVGSRLSHFRLVGQSHVMKIIRRSFGVHYEQGEFRR